MPKTLDDLYTSTLESWSPPKCPERFNSCQEIRKHEKDFQASYLNHMKALEGVVVRREGESDENNIGVIDKATPFSIHYESAPKHESGGNSICGTSLGVKTLGDIEILDILTSKQDERKGLILKRIEKNRANTNI